MKSIKVCEYSRSRSFHDDLMLQDQASGERYQVHFYQDQWSSGYEIVIKKITSKKSVADIDLGRYGPKKKKIK